MTKEASQNPITRRRMVVGALGAGLATATVFQSLRRLGLSTHVPGAGRLLSGVHDSVPAGLAEVSR